MRWEKMEKKGTSKRIRNRKKKGSSICDEEMFQVLITKFGCGHASLSVWLCC